MCDNVPPATAKEPEGQLELVPELGELGPGALVTEAGLARLLHRHPSAIKRAVQRGELPPPIRLLGAPAWTCGAVVRHLEARLEAAAKEAERLARRQRVLD